MSRHFALPACALVLCALLAPLALAAVSNISVTGTINAAAFTQSGSSTLSNSISGSAADLACTDCIGATEIGDVYLFNTGDTGTGQYVFSSTSNPGVRIGDLSTGYLQVGGSTISDAGGSLTLDSDSASTTIFEDLMVSGNDILDSGAVGRISLGETNTVTGALNVTSSLFVNSSNLALVVDALNGRLGIGDATPDYSLELSGATAPKLALSDTGLAHGATTHAETDAFFMVEQVTNDDGGARIWGFSDAAGQNPLRLVGAFGSTDPTDTVPAIWLIAGKRSGTAVANLGPSETPFQLTAADGTTHYLTVLGNGNTGVNISVPTETLHVVGNATITGGNTLKFDTSNVAAPSATSPHSGTRLLLWPGTAPSHYAIGIESLYMWFNTDGGYKFYRDAGSTPAMMIDGSGQLGINTSAPSHALTVSAFGPTVANFTSPSNDVAIELMNSEGSIAQIRNDKDDDGLQFRVNGTAAGNTRMFIGYDGKVGIGTITPSRTLNVVGTGANSIVVFNNTQAAAGKVILELDFTGDNVLGATDNFIRFLSAGGEVGSIHSDVIYATFTGAHVGQSDQDLGEWEQGMIVSSTGETLTRGVGRALVKIRLADTEKDPASVGVFMESRFPHEMKDLDRSRPAITYNALGEGMMLVTDLGGDIAVGDLITTSERAGHGMRQDDDLFHSYTVAKANEPVDWDEVQVDGGKGFKRKLIAVTYHSG